MRYDYVVLGAGVAGLAFAHKVTQQGKTVLVLEKENTIGGLSRTLEYKGFKFDFCAHRFHSSNKDLLEEVKEIVGPTFRKKPKKSRIFMFGKYLKYPFEIPNLLRAMNPIDSAHAGLSFTYNSLTRNAQKSKEIKSYKDWFVHYFGHKLYTIMCYPYTSKIWGTDPALLSADWADQRFQGPNIKQMITKAFKKVARLDFTSYSIEDDELAPDGGEFYYGDYGAQEIPDSFGKKVLESGKGKILTGALLTKVNDKSMKVDYLHDGKKYSVEARDAIITTIPLHIYYKLLERKDPDVETALQGLKYMDIIFVYLFLNKEQISNDSWLYFPDKDVIFNRAVEFKTWSKVMAPPGKTATCLDITCFENDEKWNMSDEQLVQRCKEDSEKVGMFKKDEVFDSKVIRIKHAYPFYDLDYDQKLIKIVSFLEANNKIFCLGRTGIFRYNNSDNSIEMGFELAKRLAEGNKKSILDYTIKKVSY